MQSHVEALGFSVVRDFVGHGIGRKLHEAPQVPNYGRPGTLECGAPGMVLAVEPMVNAGTHQVEVLDDGWTAVTLDGKLSAHWEHTILVIEDGHEVLTRSPARDNGLKCRGLAGRRACFSAPRLVWRRAFPCT